MVAIQWLRQLIAQWTAAAGLRTRVLLALLFCCFAVGIVLLWLEQLATEKHYSWIEDRLYVGSATHAPPPGTRAVVNLCDREDPYRVDTLLWEPIDGTRPPGIEWLQRVVEFIDEQRRAGATSYVHCLAGMNRSGMVVTAYLMYEHGWGRDEALAFVRARRPEIQPNPTDAIPG